MPSIKRTRSSSHRSKWTTSVSFLLLPYYRLVSTKTGTSRLCDTHPPFFLTISSDKLEGNRHLWQTPFLIVKVTIIARWYHNKWLSSSNVWKYFIVRLIFDILWMWQNNKVYFNLRLFPYALYLVTKSEINF